MSVFWRFFFSVTESHGYKSCGRGWPRTGSLPAWAARGIIGSSALGERSRAITCVASRGAGYHSSDALSVDLRIRRLCEFGKGHSTIRTKLSRVSGRKLLSPAVADPTLVGLSDTPLDLANVFGPMSAMHAAMDKLGVGMPCGLIARFQGRGVAEVAAAIAEATRHFPLLGLRLAWVDHRPVLGMADRTSGNFDAGSENSSS